MVRFLFNISLNGLLRMVALYLFLRLGVHKWFGLVFIIYKWFVLVQDKKMNQTKIELGPHILHIHIVGIKRTLA